MNTIICPPQANIHRITQIGVYSSIVSRLSKVSYSLSLTLLICRRFRRKNGMKNRTKVQRIVDELVNCGSPNQQLLTVKEVLRNPDLRKTNEIINSSTLSSSTNKKMCMIWTPGAEDSTYVKN